MYFESSQMGIFRCLLKCSCSIYIKSCMINKICTEEYLKSSLANDSYVVAPFLLTVYDNVI